MATRPTRHKDEILEDDELQQLILTRIDEDPAFWTGKRRTSIAVEVSDGYVTLTGVVRSPLERRRADLLARALGAAGVDNRLRLLEEPGESDETRRRSA
jgi:osmotically-inducible protein OsmY